MKRTILITITSILALLALAPFATADVPQMINYQGQLTDSSGNPLDTTVSMVFTIYDDSTGGTAWWTEPHSSVSVDSGGFSVILGSSNPIYDSVFVGGQRWLEITVGGDTIEPRTRLVTVPYANRIGTVDGATGGDIFGDLELHSTFTVRSSAFPSRYYEINAAGRQEISSTNDMVYYPGDNFAIVVDTPYGFLVGPELDYTLAVIGDKVGIGTDDPEVPLDVVGDALVRNSLEVRSTAFPSRYYEINAASRQEISSTNDMVYYPGDNFAIVVDTPYGFLVGPELDYTLAVIGDKVGIGTTTPQGALDVSSTTGAFIVPRMTTAQRDALTAVNGMIIYNTTTNQFNFREAGAWVTK